MELDKIAFENLRAFGISSSFEELDMDGDGKITEKDLEKSKDTKTFVQLNTLLNSVDEEAELVSITKAGASDDAEKTDETDTDNDTQDAEGTKAATTDDKNATEETTDNTGEYAKLQAELTAINNEIAELNKQIETLEGQNEVLKKEKEQLELQQQAKSEELEKANAELEDEEDKLNTCIEKYTDIQEEMDSMNLEILREQNREQAEYDNDVKKYTNQAIDSFNPDEDGDFNTYFANKMDSFGFPAFTRLNSLNDDASSLSAKATSVLGEISTQSNTVSIAKAKATRISGELSVLNSSIQSKTDAINANNTYIASLQCDINTKNDKKAEIQTEMGKLIEGGGMTAAEVLALVSECEKNLAKENGINLEDCLIMQGEDGNWHIYIMCEDSGYYKSIARKVLGYSEESFDMIPRGSGEIATSQFNYTDGQGKAGYKISNVNECWTDGEACVQSCCYTTCSPLSFDVDGDGIHTTSETVQYDIDGDGKLDTINNSAEWVLAFDKDHNGTAGENGSELFGNNTDLDGDGVKDGYKDGFEALKALAKQEGLISSTDNMLDENDIRKLQEKYGLVMTNGYAGEAKSLTDLGITQINLAQTTRTTLENNFDGQCNDIMRQDGATFVVNGEEREYADIWNAKKTASEDTSEIEARLNPEKETYNEASTVVKEKGILRLNKEGVLAYKGEVDLKSSKSAAIKQAEAPKIDILNEVIEDDEYDRKKEV